MLRKGKRSMGNRKLIKKYYFSVEGETEQWYLEWLRDTINANEQSKYEVCIEPKVRNDPVKYVKSLSITGKTEIYHLSDYESDESMHVKRFKTTMDRLKEASSIKQVTYRFGYSNLTFDLWMILHKRDCYSSCLHRRMYISLINSAYDEKFENMDQYKEEKNFKRCLKKLDLSDVIFAIERAKKIMNRNRESGYVAQCYKGYTYYKENPSLAIWEAIEKILADCGLYQETKRGGALR